MTTTTKPRHEFSLRMYRGGNVTSLGVAMCLGDGFLNGKFGWWRWTKYDQVETQTGTLPEIPHWRGDHETSWFENSFGVANQVAYLPTNDSNSINGWRDIYPTWYVPQFWMSTPPSWIGSGPLPRMGLKVLIDRSMVCRMWWMIPEVWWSANSDLAGIGLDGCFGTPSWKLHRWYIFACFNHSSLLRFI